MTTAEILTVVFAAVAALCACAALIVSLMRKREGGGVSPSELKNTREELTREIDFARRSIAESNSQSNTAVANMLGAYLENEEKKTDRLSEYMSSAMKELGAAERQNAERTGETLGKNLDAVKAEFKAGVADMRGDMQKQLSEIRRELVENVDKMRAEMKSALTEVRGDNEKQLEKMRATVEEKLSETLDKRVETAFKQVSDRLDSVQKGFGEMKELTSKVGNLNRIFSNVKTRGSWGEVALQSLFEQILSSEQYKTQFRLNPRSQEAVDFVVVMPGQGGEEEVYLPIDAKFPLEDYTRLVEAGDNGDKLAVEAARKALLDRVKGEARSIASKYIRPPRTTNFAVLYVPNEGLYAEIMRDGAFASGLQSEFRVTVCGPTTIAALLNSLQVGFNTLKLQKKSGEITVLMAKVKKDFGKFTDLIRTVKTRAESVVKAVEDIDFRNQQIVRKLDKFEDPEPERLTEAAEFVLPSGEEEE